MHSPNLSRVDLNLLVVFDAVARTRSVTGAADVLSLSQPAVSHALKRLRDLMRDPLFVRGRRGLVLTLRAEKCITEVQAILASVGRVLTSDEFDPAATTRSFRFAASDYAMMTIVPPIVRALRTMTPRAKIDIGHTGADLHARLEKADIDIAFAGAEEPESTIASRELFREHFVGLICERHLLAFKAGQGRLTLKEYLSFPHVAVTFRNPVRNSIDTKLAELGKTRHVAMTTPSFAANIASLRGTDLIMSLPSRLASLADRRGLVLFKLPLAVPDYPYLMSWHRRTDNDPAMKWLRSLVIETVSSVVRQSPPRRRTWCPKSSAARGEDFARSGSRTDQARIS